MSNGFLFLAVFLACAVEAVEALTIVLAVGGTRGWRSTLYGTGAALVLLALLVAVFGPALHAIPIQPLRIVVGTLLLVFGLQWLRKAILRAAGLKAQRDEEAVFLREREAAAHAGAQAPAGVDWYSFTLAFKSVLLEGLEVAFIVLTFGTTQHRVGLAAAAAGAALAAVVAIGFVVRAPLARAPENRMKFAVGALLTTFGIFWTTEGVGAHWPGSDAALLGILALVLAASFALVRLQRQVERRPVAVEADV